MPLAAERLHILPDYGQLASLALWRSPFGPLGLALDAPRVAVLLDMRHALLERIAALGTKEVPVVKVVAQRHDMLTNDGRRAGLAAGCEELVPVQVAEEAQTRVAVLCHGLPGLLGQGLAGGTASDTLQACGPERVGLRGDFEGFEGRATGVADEALGVEALGAAAEGNNTSFDGKGAFVADGSGAG